MVWLPDGETILKIRLLVLTESTNVTDRHCQTDGQTDIQTPHDSIGRACIESRSKNDSALAGANRLIKDRCRKNQEQSKSAPNK